MTDNFITMTEVQERKPVQKPKPISKPEPALTMSQTAKNRTVTERGVVKMETGPIMGTGKYSEKSLTDDIDDETGDIPDTDPE